MSNKKQYSLQWKKVTIFFF